MHGYLGASPSEQEVQVSMHSIAAGNERLLQCSGLHLWCFRVVVTWVFNPCGGGTGNFSKCTLKEAKSVIRTD